MKKVLVVCMVVLASLALGVSFINCSSSDGGEKCPNDTECCEAIPCTGGKVCSTAGACIANPCEGATECCDALPCATEGDYCIPTNTCEACCPNAAAGKTEVELYGSVVAMSLAGAAPAECDVTALKPTEVLNPTVTPVPLATATSNATTGAYKLDCFDVTDVSLGLIALIDDKAGAASDTYYPNLAGLAAYDTPADKKCDILPPAIALPNAVVDMMDAGGAGPISKTAGFVMGFVTDKAYKRLEGATVTWDNGDPIEAAPGTPLVFYPKADFSGMQASTSALGIYMINHNAYAGGGIKKVTAKKDAMVFPKQSSAIVAGKCFWLYLIEQ